MIASHTDKRWIFTCMAVHNKVLRNETYSTNNGTSTSCHRSFCRIPVPKMKGTTVVKQSNSRLDEGWGEQEQEAEAVP